MTSKRQPNAGIIKMFLTTLEEKFDAFTTALSVYSGLLSAEEVPAWEDHMIVWAEYVGDLKVSTLETIHILETAMDSNRRVDNTTYNTLPPGPQDNVEQASVSQAKGMAANVTVSTSDEDNGGPAAGNQTQNVTFSIASGDQGTLTTQSGPLNAQAQSYQPVMTPQRFTPINSVNSIDIHSGVKSGVNIIIIQ